jgi:thiol-disulfide isomerase/thioredoxin
MHTRKIGIVQSLTRSAPFAIAVVIGVAAAIALFALAAPAVRVTAAGATPTPPAPGGGCVISAEKCEASPSTAVPNQVEWGATVLPTAQVTESAIITSKAILYLFWGEGCPHCAAEKPVLADLKQRYAQLEVRDYEVNHNTDNLALFARVAAAHGFEPRAVPTTLLGRRYWEGYTDRMGLEIEQAVVACLQTGCVDAGAGIIDAPAADAQPATGSAENTAAATASSIDLPLIGTVDLQHQSLALSTLLISFVDGFNPCSVWVLTMLLAITLHTGSRKKVLIIGLVFLSVTASVYALFIAGLFTVFTVVSFTGWIQVVVALVALFFGGVNIKDYFWYKEGLSLTIADEQKPGLFRRMRGLVDASQSFWGLVAATVVLSGGVSLVEFSCTAGFPMIWTNLLASQQVSALTFLALLALYLLVYQLDELGIFLLSVFTLKATRLEEKQGRLLKLGGGVLMLTLAAVMLVNPALMNNLLNSLLIFAIALGVTLAVLLVHRRILPAFGVWIGTERNH